MALEQGDYVRIAGAPGHLEGYVATVEPRTVGVWVKGLGLVRVGAERVHVASKPPTYEVKRSA